MVSRMRLSDDRYAAEIRAQKLSGTEGCDRACNRDR